MVRLPVAAATADESSVLAHLLNRAGTVLVTVPSGRAPDGAIQFELPMANLAPGEYLIRIETGSADPRASQLVAFRVVP
jgi:hypothetical protein